MFGADQHIGICIAPTSEIGVPRTPVVLVYDFHALFEMPLVLVGESVDDLLICQKRCTAAQTELDDRHCGLVGPCMEDQPEFSVGQRFPLSRSPALQQ